MAAPAYDVHATRESQCSQSREQSQRARSSELAGGASATRVSAHATPLSRPRAERKKREAARRDARGVYRRAPFAATQLPLRTLLTYRARRHDVNRATRLAVNQTSTRKHISARRRRRIRSVKHALASQRHRARSLGRGARGAIRSMHGRGATAQTDGALPNAARPTMPRAVAAPHQSSAE